MISCIRECRREYMIARNELTQKRQGSISRRDVLCTYIHVINGRTFNERFNGNCKRGREFAGVLIKDVRDGMSRVISMRSLN